MSEPLFPTELRVKRLFGSIDHLVHFNGSRANIIAGPNGCGKTHTLRILRAAMALDFNELLALPYAEAAITFTNDTSILLKRGRAEKIETLALSYRNDASSSVIGRATVTSEQFDPTAAYDLPAWLHAVNSELWVDERSDRYMTGRDVERRLGIRVPDLGARAEVIATHSWLQPISDTPAPVFIDTKRLDTIMSLKEDDTYASRIRNARGNNTAARIGQYIEQVRDQILEAKQRSLDASQTADERFAFNLMNMAHAAVKQDAIERDYADLARLNSELSGNGLSGRPIDVKLRTRMNPTEKRVLNLFLQDWVKKLAPLLPVHEKLTALRRIINEKFHNKTMLVAPDGMLTFRNGDVTIPVAQLSSGEQHLLALFTQLLFAASSGSMVLIDEPEISLHAAWKHSFVADIEAVAKISNLSILMATHSTAVINGRWDIVSELGVEAA